MRAPNGFKECRHCRPPRRTGPQTRHSQRWSTNSGRIPGALTSRITPPWQQHAHPRFTRPPPSESEGAAASVASPAAAVSVAKGASPVSSPSESEGADGFMASPVAAGSAGANAARASAVRRLAAVPMAAGAFPVSGSRRLAAGGTARGRREQGSAWAHFAAEQRVGG